MKKLFKNREEARQFRRELVVPILVECGLFAVESFIADSLIPGYVTINRDRLQTARGKAGFVAGCVISYPALVGANLWMTDRFSKAINDVIDDLELESEGRKVAHLYAKGFTPEEIGKALDIDPAVIREVIVTYEAKYGKKDIPAKTAE